MVRNFPTHGQPSAAQGSPTNCLNFDFAFLNCLQSDGPEVEHGAHFLILHYPNPPWFAPVVAVWTHLGSLRCRPVNGFSLAGAGGFLVSGPPCRLVLRRDRLRAQRLHEPYQVS
jgi:hypothetical protein